MVANKTSQSLQPSVFESPLYERSYKGHSVCVRFRYIMYGFGRRVLRLYQQLHSINKTKRLMWAVNESNNTDGTWKYGRVSLPSVTKHRVSTSPLFTVFLHYVQKTQRDHLSMHLILRTLVCVNNGIAMFYVLCFCCFFVLFFSVHPFKRVSWLPECQIRLACVYNYSKKVNSMYVGNTFN